MPLDTEQFDTEIIAKIDRMSIEDLSRIRDAVELRAMALRSALIAQAEALGLHLAPGTGKKRGRKPRNQHAE